MTDAEQDYKAFINTAKGSLKEANTHLKDLTKSGASLNLWKGPTIESITELSLTCERLIHALENLKTIIDQRERER